MKRDRLLLTMLTFLLALTATSSLCAQAGDLRARMMDLPGQQPVAGALVSSTGSDHNHEPVNPHGSAALAGSAPSGAQGAAPSPLPTLAGTQVEQWVQTTIADFAPGAHSGTITGPAGDGEIRLAPGRDTGAYLSAVKEVSLEFVAIGTVYEAALPSGTAITVELRSSADGSSWEDWLAVPPMDAQREESHLEYGELLYLRGRYVQYRLILTSPQAGISPQISSLTLIFIDSRAGRTAAEAHALAVASAPTTGPVIISRAAWGADESLMTWTPEYRTVVKFVVHHTATSNGDLDPAATVRAIYYYHAVTRGWGDIGYNYLVDTQGRIYEGRKGGEGVVGGHAKQYAWGSIGVSLIGDYDQIDVPAAMQTGLVELMAWKANRHFVDPTGHGFFIDQDLPNIMAHRDGADTTCPGRYAYARLDAIRRATATRMAQLPPAVRIDTPLAEARVSGVVSWTVSASPPVTQASFYVDDRLVGSDSSVPLAWKWNSTAVQEGQHLLRTVVRLAGFEAQATVTVTVDNTAPQWLGWDGTAALVRDGLSGLHVSSAQVARSDDGGSNWSAWEAFSLTATEGTTTTILVQTPASGATHIRFRIADRAGNLSESPAYAFAGVVPTPTTTPSATATRTATRTMTPSPTPTATSTLPPSATALPGSTPTGTPTPPDEPAHGSIVGRVILQGRSAHGGVTVSAGDTLAITTLADGSYWLADVPTATYTLTLHMAGYLQSSLQVTVSPGANIALPDVVLRAGDVNNDCAVNLIDLVLVSISFGRNPPTHANADLNGDGSVNLFDLVLMSLNLGRTCPGS